MNGCAVFTPAGSIVHFQHTDQRIGLALLDHRGHIGTAVAVPASTGGEHYAHRVGTRGSDIGKRLRRAPGIPGMRVVYTAHYKWLAIGIQ